MSGIKIPVPIKLKVDPYKEVEVNECLFRCYESGKVERQMNVTSQHGICGDWKRCDTNKPVKGGYLRVMTKNGIYYLHRIVYLAFNPTFDITDTKIMIDHINRDKLDNRPANLREATCGENQCNIKTRSNTGLKNIYDLGYNWYVRIIKDGKKVVDRHFNKKVYTLDDVKLYRDDELLKHHGEFARLDS